ncbi:transporter substrate-binding domain-containing protein [Pseudodesulfovibrio sp.]|uniref:substrate-binding periplasmic protein n=1 Tax=Pseudodesulfovibrio sp. TaxID=2035812 RepID=UPI002631E01F|nr:transporter substrate-binding domain-containing protein [Pseudodesulfovibrio sp.]MDD3311518.1 transporter substrate-binding domain-containing protein [Pseudodesulfovibrio sp.]
MRFRQWYPIVLLLLLPSAASAADIAEVITTSPAWDTFTNQDGTGLYHEVLREVFALYHVTVRHEYATSARAVELVKAGATDMMTCDDVVRPPLVLARYPLYSNDFYAFFNKKRIGRWKGLQSLWGKEILVQPGYYSSANFPVPVNLREMMTGAQAVSMILLDRADFYVDDLALIREALGENTIPYVESEFTTRQVGRRAYFPLFSSTLRAQRIKKMYEEGMLRLFREGRLQPIYTKWGYACPDMTLY